MKRVIGFVAVLGMASSLPAAADNTADVMLTDGAWNDIGNEYPAGPLCQHRVRHLPSWV